MTARLPALFIPHGGGPCFFVKPWPVGDPNMWDRLEAYLAAIPKSLPMRPKALLVVSAHWEETIPTVLTAAAPPMLFDYSGFPPHTYELSWPAPGSPTLAERVRSSLAGAGIESGENEARGFDHGVFVPMLISYPDADVPTIQLSLRSDLDPALHLQIGRALEPLRSEGVLIIGSGMSYHNMQVFRDGGDKAGDSARFDEWLAQTVQSPAPEREARLSDWTTAPAARSAHPREEHLLPLMVVAGASARDRGAPVFTDTVMGATVSAYRFG